MNRPNDAPNDWTDANDWTAPNDNDNRTSTRPDTLRRRPHNPAETPHDQAVPTTSHFG
jgi:hypothetical protein